MFKATSNRGFSITFENGNTVSVQWGPHNYCDPEHAEGRDAPWDAPEKSQVWASANAEVAAWNSDKEWHNFSHDQVAGWQSADEVASFIAFVSNNELSTKKHAGEVADELEGGPEDEESVQALNSLFEY
jgi:hypothetical protein